ncbi:MAG: hypothetical protein K2G89_10480 [Lachnospiraceae bacterium]|nr:hypothetical protein [Lachnospiraceae bacterium]
MRRRNWMKRIAAFSMAMVMAASMSGCGKKSGGGGANDSAKLDTKDMVYAAEEINFEGIQGDFSGYTVKDDKIYFTTYEWFENGVSGGAHTTATEPEEDTDTAEEPEDGAETEPGDDTDAVGEPEDGADTEPGNEADTGTEPEDGADTEPGDDADAEAEPEDSTGDAPADVEYTSISRLYSANLDGTNVTEIPFSVGDNEGIQSMVIDNDGNLRLLISNWNDANVKYTVVTLDSAGKELAHIDLTDALKIGNDEYLSKMLLDGEGNLCIVKDSAISVLDKDGKPLQEIKADNNIWMEGAALTKDGKLIYGYSDEEGAKVQSVDPKSGQKGDVYALDIRYFNSSDNLMNGIDYDFYYKDDSGVYGYSIADKKSTKLLDYVASDLSSNNSYMNPITGNRFVGTVYDWGKGGSDGTKFCIYTKVDPSQVADKTVITYGGMWISDDIKTAAVAFNKASDKYKIVFKDYSDEEDPNTKFNADIVAGNVPDIIDLSGISVNQYASMGILEDLTPYYEKDADVKLDDILDNVVDAMKINDKIYYVAPSFSIYTMIAKKSDVGDKKGWTMKEMQELIQSKGSGTRPFQYNDKESLMYSMISQSISEFVNWETGECTFESEAFKEALELCNTGTSGEPDYENMPSLPKEIQSGNVYLQTDTINFDSIQLYEKMFGEDIAFIGYPCEDRQGSYLSFNMMLGIYAKSEVKDAAWEFVKTLMGKEFQYENAWYGTPTRKDVFEMRVKAVMTTEPYTDEMGQEVNVMDSSWGWDDLEVKIGPLSEKQMNLYKELLGSIHKVSSYNDEIMTIIQEEVKAYFAGEKSVDETAKLIQNRVSTYVNESR